MIYVYKSAEFIETLDVAVVFRHILTLLSRVSTC